MLRSWLPQRQLVHHHLHSKFLWRPRASFIFLHHLYTSAFCSDRRRRLSASVSEDSISTLQKKSKGQKKREALRAVDWAAEFATFSDSQLRRAIRWGNLKGEVYDAVKVVKKIGRYGKHARTRQLKLIGGMLRAADPELMETVIKAIKDGDVEGVFNRSSELIDEDGEDDEDDDDDDNNEEDNNDNDEEDDDDFDSDDYQQQNLSSDDDDTTKQYADTVEKWFKGLLSGDSDVIAEVYSIRSASFNRQELRRLVRDALKSQRNSSEKNNKDSFQAVLEEPASMTQILDPQGKLRDYLENLAAKVQDDV